MAALQILVLTAAIAASGETVLLDFSADWCPPCRSMEPVLKRMTAEGYPVRQINIEQHREYASQFRVTGLPTFVLISNGREVQRIEGAVSQAELVKMFSAVGFDPREKKESSIRTVPKDNGMAQKGESTTVGLLSKAIGSMSAGQNKTVSADRQAGHYNIDSARSAASKSGSSLSPKEVALRATVRLTVEDPDGTSYGTGTIIDTHGEEALIVTCGHIFRDSKGKGKITIDLYTPSGNLHVKGQLLAYDATNKDIGLVSFRPGVQVTPVRVAPEGYSLLREARVFSVGCDHGADPSIRQSKITAVNKYLGPPNIEIAGQPVQGRSGGGLFSAEGMLIGVCNAADPADDEGIYSALETVQWQLNQIGQANVYRQDRQMLAQADKRARVRELSSEHPSSDQRPLVRLASHGDGANRGSIRDSSADQYSGANQLEAICILRSHSEPNGKGELIVINNPSRELLELLRRESQMQNRAIPALQVTRGTGPPRPSPEGTAALMAKQSQIVRGQSSDN